MQSVKKLKNSKQCFELLLWKLIGKVVQVSDSIKKKQSCISEKIFLPTFCRNHNSKCSGRNNLLSQLSSNLIADGTMYSGYLRHFQRLKECKYPS